MWLALRRDPPAGVWPDVDAAWSDVRTALAQAQAKLGQQAETARRFGREDLARAARARQETARSQLAALGLQYDQLLAEEAGLEAKLTTTAQALQAKIDALSRSSE